MMKVRVLFVLTLTLTVLSACGGTRESLGLGRSVPDEYAVVDRPPLSMPPDYTLRPPRPGAERPQDVNLTQRASETLFGGETKAAAAPAEGGGSSSEQVLLQTAGASSADPNIRETVDREAAQKVVASEHLVERLLWWQNKEQPGTTVDAPMEAARIEAAKEKGEPINQGATPVIQRKKTGFLGF